MSSIIEKSAQDKVNAAKAAKLDEVDRKIEMEGLAKLAADKAAADEIAKMTAEIYKYGGMHPNVVSPFATPSKPVDVIGYIKKGGSGTVQYPNDIDTAARLAEFDRLNKLYGTISGGIK